VDGPAIRSRKTVGTKVRPADSVIDENDGAPVGCHGTRAEDATVYIVLVQVTRAFPTAHVVQPRRRFKRN